MTVPDFREFLRYWLRLGFVNFGGPAGQIAMMHRDLVQARGWVEERLFQRALGFCMLLPGPEAHQLAVYLGWRMHGLAGGLAAGLLFLLPAALLMFGLSWLAAAHGDAPAVAGLFRGVAGAVVAIVAQALWRMARKSLTHPMLYGFAAASFLMGYMLNLKFHGVVVGSAIMGLWLGQVRPELFCRMEGGACAPEPEEQRPSRPPLAHVGRVFAVCVALWLSVALPLRLLAPAGSILPAMLAFYTKASFLAFGGAYAVLTHVADTAARLGWASADQVALGLGLAETTPGPLILVTQFVGFLSAWNQPGGLDPLAAGLLGGFVATFGMFLPSFFAVFAGAPYVESLTANPRVRAALTGITAAVVGVVLKLAVVFATATFLPARLSGNVDFFALGAALLSGLALWRWNTAVHILVLCAAGAGGLWALLGF